MGDNHPWGPRKLFHPPITERISSSQPKRLVNLCFDLCSPTHISLLLPEWSSAFKSYSRWEDGLSACLDNKMEVSNLSENLDKSLIPALSQGPWMFVFFFKAAGEWGRKAETGDGHRQKGRGWLPHTNGQQASQTQKKKISDSHIAVRSSCRQFLL